MKEQYVTFKVAVRMKELGFNWPCGAYCRAPYDTLVKTEIDCTNADCDAQSQYEKNPDRDPSGNVFNIVGHEQKCNDLLRSKTFVHDFRKHIVSHA